jgi:hypothetical protein
MAVELWKLANGVRVSTGGVFVIPPCLGIVVAAGAACLRAEATGLAKEAQSACITRKCFAM